jgi:hypothetical protein
MTSGYHHHHHHPWSRESILRKMHFWSLHTLTLAHATWSLSSKPINIGFIFLTSHLFDRIAFWELTEEAFDSMKESRAMSRSSYFQEIHSGSSMMCVNWLFTRIDPSSHHARKCVFQIQRLNDSSSHLTLSLLTIAFLMPGSRLCDQWFALAFPASLE